MGENKKYYWLKLKDDFFKDKEIKKLRRIAGGDTYTIIYLKLQLLSLKREGKLVFDNLEDTFAEEMALELDENTENVKMTLMYLDKCGLIEEVAKDEFMLPQAMKSIGTETQGAERMRRCREKKELSQCDGQALLSDSTVTNGDTEIRDKREEIDKEIEIKEVQGTTKVVCSNKLQPVIDKWNSLNLSKIISINGNRQKLLNTRIKENSIDKVLMAIENINTSDFLKGQNERSWIITFDWFVKPNNFIKVLEGNYINKGANNASNRENTSTGKGKWKGYTVPTVEREHLTNEEISKLDLI